MWPIVCRVGAIIHRRRFTLLARSSDQVLTCEQRAGVRCVKTTKKIQHVKNRDNKLHKPKLLQVKNDFCFKSLHAHRHRQQDSKTPFYGKITQNPPQHSTKKLPVPHVRLIDTASGRASRCVCGLDLAGKQKLQLRLEKENNSLYFFIYASGSACKKRAGGADEMPAVVRARLLATVLVAEDDLPITQGRTGTYISLSSAASPSLPPSVTLSALRFARTPPLPAPFPLQSRPVLLLVIPSLAWRKQNSAFFALAIPYNGPVVQPGWQHLWICRKSRTRDQDKR